MISIFNESGNSSHKHNAMQVVVRLFCDIAPGTNQLKTLRASIQRATDQQPDDVRVDENHRPQEGGERQIHVVHAELVRFQVRQPVRDPLVEKNRLPAGAAPGAVPTDPQQACVWKNC